MDNKRYVNVEIDIKDLLNQCIEDDLITELERRGFSVRKKLKEENNSDDFDLQRQILGAVLDTDMDNVNNKKTDINPVFDIYSNCIGRYCSDTDTFLPN